MTMTDTGPIVALLDDDDPYHAAVLATARVLPADALLTTWPCYTEAMYLLGEAGGYRYQERLWQMRRTGRLRLLELSDAEADRMGMLMKQYSDVPMDLADASLIAVAESRGIRRLFTLDSDFYFYVLADGSVVEVIR